MGHSRYHKTGISAIRSDQGVSTQEVATPGAAEEVLTRSAEVVQLFRAPRPVTVCHQEPAPQGVPLGHTLSRDGSIESLISSSAKPALRGEDPCRKTHCMRSKGADIAKRQQHLESCYTKQCGAHLHGTHSCHRAHCNSLMSLDVALQVQQKVTTDIEGIETELVGSSACKICMLESAEASQQQINIPAMQHSNAWRTMSVWSKRLLLCSASMWPLSGPFHQSRQLLSHGTQVHLGSNPAVFMISLQEQYIYIGKLFACRLFPKVHGS